MKVRKIKLIPRPRYIPGPDHRQWKDIVKGKYLLLKVIETGYDEHNSWEEYIILRGK